MTTMRRLTRMLSISAVLALGATFAACGPASSEVVGEVGPPRPEQDRTPVAAAMEAPPGDTAQGLLPTPKLTPCAATTHPLLPAKWEAVGMLQSFVEKQLVFGKFVFDESAKAFRFTMADQYGVNEDLLATTDGSLYRLQGGDVPTSCTLVTDRSPYTVPARDWLQGGAQCVGEAPILKRNQQWWKNPAGAVGANWFWYGTDNRLPFRSMYYAAAKPTTPVPIYEYFTFNYFPTFQPVASTSLPQIVAECQRTKTKAPAVSEFSSLSIAPILKKSAYPSADAASAAKIEKWIPGLTSCSSTGDLPPPWPQQVQATAFMTAVSFKPNPFPTRIFYDWTKRALNTTLYNDPPTPDSYAMQALLLSKVGYGSSVSREGTHSKCAQALPPAHMPNWAEVDHCECRAQIAPHTVLNPSDVPTKVLWCPTDLSKNQVFWTWYSNTGTPVVFMQSNSSPTDGTGLNLADYHAWAPGSVAPNGTFDVPAACQGAPAVPYPRACNNCHAAASAP